MARIQLPQADKAILGPFLAALSQAHSEDQRTAFIQEHITSGEPRGAKAAVVSEIRDRLSKALGASKEDMLVVGSGKLGFSLKKKGPEEKRFCAFNTDPNRGKISDIDVAIVCPIVFNTIWDELYIRALPNRQWALHKDAKDFIRDLFNGFINPDVLRKLGETSAKSMRRRVFDVLDKLNADRIAEPHTVTCRLYRDRTKLEHYQSFLVTECYVELRR